MVDVKGWWIEGGNPPETIMCSPQFYDMWLKVVRPTAWRLRNAVRAGVRSGAAS